MRPASVFEILLAQLDFLSKFDGSRSSLADSGFSGHQIYALKNPKLRSCISYKLPLMVAKENSCFVEHE
ncbi:MAG: hypothetical protein A3J67_05180 [Parcubacteria group bacterium RIFCSPHIGHO2_02_FULL_48_10b]|nr:MAG: hypothetical protein A3J67_05180 [Parcubacteria group bacterium RIFCSPHIGHO2_02_FULL_48_10b]